MSAAHDPSAEERNAGLLLIAASAIALVLANSPLADAWHHLLEAPLGIELPRIGMLTPHLVVADGLMAIFFLLVGLEVKRPSDACRSSRRPAEWRFLRWST